MSESEKHRIVFVELTRLQSQLGGIDLHALTKTIVAAIPSTGLAYGHDLGDLTREAIESLVLVQAREQIRDPFAYVLGAFRKIVRRPAKTESAPTPTGEDDEDRAMRATMAQTLAGKTPQELADRDARIEAIEHWRRNRARGAPTPWWALRSQPPPGTEHIERERLQLRAPDFGARPGWAKPRRCDRRDDDTAVSIGSVLDDVVDDSISDVRADEVP